MALQAWLGMGNTTGCSEGRADPVLRAVWSLQSEGDDSRTFAGIVLSCPCCALPARWVIANPGAVSVCRVQFNTTAQSIHFSRRFLLLAGLLFCFCDYSDAALDHHLYSLLAMGIFAGALCALLEVFLRDHIILEIFRTSSFLLQGSWLWQVSAYPVLFAEQWAPYLFITCWG